MAASAVGAGCIIALDRNENRLELALKYGATDALNVPAGDLTAAIRERTGGVGADYALDLTGSPDVIRACFDGLHNNGTLGLCGVGFGEVTFDLATLLSGRTIKPVIEGDAVPATFIPQLIELNAQGRFPYDELIESFPLEQINEAVQASTSGRVVKPVLTFG